MHKLYKLLEQEELEFDTAEDYIHCANNTEGEIKNKYCELAEDELEHVETLISIGDKLKYEKDTKGAIIWEFERECIKKKHTALKVKLSQVK